jgi:hypothetical protein
LLLRCALTREPLVACLRARFSSEEIEKAYTHYIDAVMKRCLQRRPQALSTVAIDQDTNQVVGVLINDLLEVCFSLSQIFDFFFGTKIHVSYCFRTLHCLLIRNY